MYLVVKLSIVVSIGLQGAHTRLCVRELDLRRGEALQTILRVDLWVLVGFRLEFIPIWILKLQGLVHKLQEGVTVAGR